MNSSLLSCALGGQGKANALLCPPVPQSLRIGVTLLLLAGAAALSGCTDDSAPACAAGTKAKDGKCVIDDQSVAFGDLAKPLLQSVKLTELVVREEGVRPIYPTHPAHVGVKLSVVGEPFSAMVVVGLETKDGGKRCVLGQTSVTFVGTPATAAGATAQPAEVSFNTEFYVQPECADLAGTKDARAWVSFDPFGDVRVVGVAAAKATANDKNPTATLIQQRRLPLAGCLAPASPHPTTCETAIEVQASPGKDLAITNTVLSSSVVVYNKILQPQLLLPGGPEADGALPGNPPKASDYSVGVATTPHLLVTTTSLMFGVSDADKDPLKDADLKLTFAIRPDPTDLPQGSTAIDWAPLYTEVQKANKAGPPTIEQLKAAFIKNMAAATVHHKGSPVFIAKESAALMDNDWAGVNKFEVRACLSSNLIEAGVDADPLANNCSVTPVIVLHREVSTLPAGVVQPGQPGPTGGAGVNWSEGYNTVQGNAKDLQLTLKVGSNGSVGSSIGYARAGAYAGLSGWVALSFLNHYAVANYSRTSAGVLAGTRNLHWEMLNTTLSDTTEPLSINVVIPPVKVASYALPALTIYGAEYSIPAVATIKCAVQAGGELSMTLAGKLSADTSGASTCIGAGTSDGDSCFLAAGPKTDSTWWKSRFEAEADCKSKGAILPEPQSVTATLALYAETKKASVGTGSWLGLYQQQHASAPAGANIYSDVGTCVNQDCVKSEYKWVWPTGRPVSFVKVSTGSSGAYYTPVKNGYRATSVGTTTAAFDIVNQASKRPYVCEYAKPARAQLDVTVTPTAAIALSGVAGLGAECATDLESDKAYAGVKISIAALQVSAPIHAGIVIQGPFADKTTVQSYGVDGTLTLSTLNGAISWLTKIHFAGVCKALGGNLFAWDGIDLASWNLFNFQRRNYEVAGLDNGYACASASVCSSAKCAGGKCVQCLADGDCPGQFCAASGLCQAKLGAGSACTVATMCAGATCTAGTCVKCPGDAACGSGNYCAADGGCHAKIGLDLPCLAGNTCASGICSSAVLGFCVQCLDDAGCSSGQFCDLLGLCKAKLGSSGLCVKSGDCTSGKCLAGFCIDCTSDSECASGKFCDAFSLCRTALPADSLCVKNSACASGKCPFGLCQECSADGDCASGKFCDAQSHCQTKLTGSAVCLKNSACASGKCPAGFCIDCSADTDCAGGKFCDAFNYCQTPLANGNSCVKNSACASIHCPASLCAQCAADTDCPGQFCDATYSCKAKLPSAALCLKNSACASGKCPAGLCIDCSSDTDCTNGKYCDALGYCQTGAANGQLCLKNSGCASGHCPASLCAQCAADTDCPGGQFCDGTYKCQAKLGTALSCLKDSACVTGHCTGALCACWSDNECSSGKYCSANSCFSKMADGNSCVATGAAGCSSGLCCATICATVKPNGGSCGSDCACSASSFCSWAICTAKLAKGTLCSSHYMCASGSCKSEYGIYKCQ